MDTLLESEREIIAKNIPEIELRNETITLREKYLRRSRKEQDIITNKEVDADAKVKAHYLAAELDKAVHHRYYETPSYLAGRTRRLLSSSLLSSLEEAYCLHYEKAMKEAEEE
ncbi:MAG: hypothetical protein ACJ71D_08015 [Nitrososphaera sp.]